MKRLLIIDDEPAFARVLQPVLSAKGWQVLTSISAVDGLRTANENAPDVVLLDLGLPDLDGKEIIAELKAHSGSAVIIISARHQEVEKVAALDAGADDYVDKPFGMEELLARVRAAHRRYSGGSDGRVRIGDLQLDFGSRKATLLGMEVKFSPKEFDLLSVLARHAGQVVTHRRLLVAGWGDPHVDHQYLRSYVALIRQKLEEDPSEPQLLLSEPGVGYRLKS